MIIVIIKDGLGNQLFQYAAAKCLAEKLNTSLKLDIKSYEHNKLRKYSLHHFLIKEEIATKTEIIIFRAKNIISKIFNKVGIRLRSFRYFENSFSFADSFFAVKNNSIVEGYWQSEKYFTSIETIIRKEFVVKYPLTELTVSYIDKISSVESVSLHIRRGDYVTNKTVNDSHGVCDLNYYQQAIAIMRSKLASPVFFIFSDDMPWVKENLVMAGDAVEYVEMNGEKDYEELRLMYTCKHNIIANSSFSWWGAWLNNNPQKMVIAPKKWFYNSDRDGKDIVPAEWMKV